MTINGDMKGKSFIDGKTTVDCVVFLWCHGIAGIVSKRPRMKLPQSLQFHKAAARTTTQTTDCYAYELKPTYSEAEEPVAFIDEPVWT
jgi:hypothetical protein